MAKRGIILSLVNIVSGIALEIFATLILMGAAFLIGLLILTWVSK